MVTLMYQQEKVLQEQQLLIHTFQYATAQITKAKNNKQILWVKHIE